MNGGGVGAASSGGFADGELRRKIGDYQARERIYLAGLIEQDAQMNRLRSMTSDVLGAYGDLSQASLRGALSDPICNMEVLMLRQKAYEKEQLIKQLREELESNRFDQQTPQGQQLMHKCRLLLEENRELGDQLRQERMAEVAEVLAAKQRHNQQLEQKLREAAKFCKELGQESEMLQGTVAKVAGKLREARAEFDVLRRERSELKAKRKLQKEQQKAAAAAAAQTTAAMLQASTRAVPFEEPVPVKDGEKAVAASSSTAKEAKEKASPAKAAKKAKAEEVVAVEATRTSEREEGEPEVPKEQEEKVKKKKDKKSKRKEEAEEVQEKPERAEKTEKADKPEKDRSAKKAKKEEKRKRKAETEEVQEKVEEVEKLEEPEKERSAKKAKKAKTK